MTKSIEKIITDKWKIILLEYEKVKNKRSTHFKTVTALCEAYSVSRKTLHKYHGRWVQSGKNEESLLPRKRGPAKGSNRLLSKEEERILIKIQRRFEAKPYDIWCLVKGEFEVHPSARTIARILKRYPRNKKKEIIHRYEKRIPGELIHGDILHLPKELFKDREKRYLHGLIDDCTRLSYVELLEWVDSLSTSKSLVKGGKWFDLHGIEIETLMTDNGSEYTSVHRKRRRRKLTLENKQRKSRRRRIKRR